MYFHFKFNSCITATKFYKFFTPLNAKLLEKRMCPCDMKREFLYIKDTVSRRVFVLMNALPIIHKDDLQYMYLVKIHIYTVTTTGTTVLPYYHHPPAPTLTLLSCFSACPHTIPLLICPSSPPSSLS